LDEPTTGLDPAVRLALWARVRDLRAAGTTILLTTHYMDEAQRLCDRVAIVANGRIIAEGAPGALIATQMAHEAVEFDCSPEDEADLLDGMPTPHHRLRTGRRLIVYLDDPTPLVERLHQRDPDDQRTLIVRPSNLGNLCTSCPNVVEGEASDG
jgi:lipooligosaccharide transport system ATP-binding protein